MTDDLPELTREDAIEAMQDMAYDLYRAQDRIGFVREMLETHTGPLTAEEVRGWLDRPVCSRAESEQQAIARLEALLAEVWEYVETSDDDGVTARETVLRLLAGQTTPHDHQACERCDVTDPCPCCGLRWQDGRWVNADGSPYTVGGVAPDKDAALLARIRQLWWGRREHPDLDEHLQRLERVVNGSRRPSTLDVALLAILGNRSVQWLLTGEQLPEETRGEFFARSEWEDIPDIPDMAGASASAVGADNAETSQERP